MTLKGVFGSELGVVCQLFFRLLRLFTELVELSARCQSPGIHPLIATNGNTCKSTSSGTANLSAFSTVSVSFPQQRALFTVRGEMQAFLLHSISTPRPDLELIKAAHFPFILLFLSTFLLSPTAVDFTWHCPGQHKHTHTHIHTHANGELYINVLHTFQRQDLCTSNSG